MTQVELGQVFSCWSNVSRLWTNALVKSSPNSAYSSDQGLTKIRQSIRGQGSGCRQKYVMKSETASSAGICMKLHILFTIFIIHPH